MALARCEMHGQPIGQIGRYIKRTSPRGYPDSAILCPRAQCVHTAFIWLDEDEARNYAGGRRDFELPRNTEKIWVQ
jgi:hypothetical protein